MSEPSFTGRTRKRTTSRRVVFADKASRFLITTGGIGTIIAVIAICVFLVFVVVPLFDVGSLSGDRRLALPAQASEDGGDAHVLATAIDEYDLISWELFADGTLDVHRLEPWESIRSERPFGDAVPTAWAFEPRRMHAVFGFEDGSIRIGVFRFEETFLEKPDPAPLADLDVGETRVWEGGVVQRTPERQLRLQRFAAELDDAMEREAKGPIHALDISVVERGEQQQPIIAALDVEGRLTVYTTRKRKNLMTGKVTTTLTPSPLPYEHAPDAPLPQRIFLSSLGDVVFLIWDDGRLVRYSRSAETGKWSLAEKVDLVPEDGETISVAGFLIGKGSLVVGDTTGRVGVWFRARPEEGVASNTPDGFRFARAHVLYEGGPVATALAPSSRSRLLGVGFANGDVRTIFVTNRNHVAGARAGEGPVERLALSPRESVLLAATPHAFHAWKLDPKYPDVTWSSLFLPVWYEGHGGPEHVWQSTGLTNEFEAKMGLMPLLFGTLKATFYSLLFGVPIALLAAVFTSEFLSSRVKVPIKSTIEVMASLPSVVLGFLAALVIAPFVQDVVPGVLLAFLLIPVLFLLGAYVWQLLPHAFTLRLGLGARFVAMGLILALGVWFASLLGPPVERAFFWVAEHQQSVTFEEASEAPDVRTLPQGPVAAAVRLHQPGFREALEVPEDATPERRQEVARLADARLVWHDGTWRRHYEPGKDFEVLDVATTPEGEAVTFANLDAPLRLRRIERGGEGIQKVVDGDTASERKEKSLYAGVGRKGDITAWLSQPTTGPATGGWLILTLPLMGLLGVFVMAQAVRPWFRRATAQLGRFETALADLARFGAGAVLMLLLSWGAASMLTAAGLDPRGLFVDTYIQRNALIVGFVMGFAIIPIIYTLAEDALSSVPSHLREGSLGAGATPWQTAMRIIVPTAMSGLFSAVMIGLGRAVGETMIVLMAAGNTPIMDINLFNGFRTLSANIAVELPEAVQGDSHYRVLFLNALVLFALTFVVNTFAEAVRQRFRKRAFQL